MSRSSLWKDCCRHVHAWLRWVRRRVVWIFVFLVFAARLFLAHSLIAETGVYALEHGLITAGFLFIGRLVWIMLLDAVHRLVPIAA